MIGRPRQNEASSYYFRYIDKVEGSDVVAELELQLGQPLRTLESSSEQQSLNRYAPDKWSIRQVLSHVVDAERVFAFRAFWFARGFESPLPSFDQDSAGQAAAADSVSWADHLQDFKSVRGSTISLFRGLGPEAAMRTGIASDNLFTVRALAYIIAGHFNYHMEILRDRYLQGAARRI